MARSVLSPAEGVTQQRRISGIVGHGYRIMQGACNSDGRQDNACWRTLKSTLTALATLFMMDSALCHPIGIGVPGHSSSLTLPEASPPALANLWVSESGTYLLTANMRRAFDGRVRYTLEHHRDGQWEAMLDCALSCVILESFIDDEGHVLALAVDSSTHDPVDQVPLAGRFTVLTFTRAGLSRELALITSTAPSPHSPIGLPRLDGFWKLDDSTVALRCSGGDGPEARGMEYVFRVRDAQWALDAGPRSVSFGAVRVDSARAVACMVPGTLLQLVAWEGAPTGKSLDSQDALYIRVYSPSGLSVLDKYLLLDRTAGPDSTAPFAVGRERNTVEVRPRNSQSTVYVEMGARDIGQRASSKGTVRILPTSDSARGKHDADRPTRLVIRGRTRLGDDKSPRPVPDVIGVSPNGSVAIVDLVHGLWTEYDRAGARDYALAFSPGELGAIIPGQCATKSPSGALIVGAKAPGGQGVYLVELTREDKKVASRRVTGLFAGRTLSCVEYPHLGHLAVIDGHSSLRVAASDVYTEGPIVDLDGVRIQSIYGVAFDSDGSGAAVASVLLRDGREVPCFLAYDQRGQTTHLEVDSLRVKPLRTSGMAMRNGKALVLSAGTTLVVWDPSSGAVESLECAAMCNGGQPQLLQYARDTDEILLIDERTLDITHIGVE